MIQARKSMNSIADYLRKVNDKSEKDLFEFIREYYQEIFSLIYKDKYDKFKHLANSAKFLSALNQVFVGNQLRGDVLIECNNFLYDIIVYNPEPYIRRLVFMVGDTVNRHIVDKLLKLGFLDKELCIFLAIAHRSTFKEYVSIRRVNFTIEVNKNLDRNQLTQIYYILYAERFTPTFTAIMLDNTISDAVDSEAEWVTDRMVHMDEVIKLTAIYILESMTPAAIARVLRTYYETYKTVTNLTPNKAKSIREVVMHNPNFIKVPIILQELEGYDIVIP